VGSGIRKGRLGNRSDLCFAGSEKPFDKLRNPRDADRNRAFEKVGAEKRFAGWGGGILPKKDFKKGDSTPTQGKRGRRHTL